MDLILKYFTDFTDTQLQQLGALKDLYEDWNKKINVISRKDMDNFYEHHVLHSLSIAAQFEFPDGYSIMDLGCGGGFPGIPLAILFPNIQFYMVDSINKKLKVVAAVASSIGLKNIITQHARAEDLQNKKGPVPPGGFNVIISRAVAPLKDLWKWSEPLLKKANDHQSSLNGLICLKGGDLKKEIAECGCSSHVWEIGALFSEPFFKEKYILRVDVGQ
jgi:16S rRNA (guanine527-N7)-methyltransferase